MSLIGSFAGPAIAIGSLLLGILALGRRAYRRVVFFDPKFDYQCDFSESTGKEVVIKVDRAGFMLPAEAREYDTGFLELRVRATPAGHLRDPSAEMRSGELSSETSFERGAKGLRYLNVSPFLEQGGQIRARGRHMKWKEERARLRLWKNAPLNNERVLIVAPHPDDAEIAAHRLYTETKAHILTICAGDCSSWNLSKIEARREQQADVAARLRVWDAMTTPGLAGLPPEHSIQLAYPDDGLAGMNCAPNKDFRPTGYNFGELRRLNRSAIRLKPEPACSWESLINDLRQILMELKPTVLVLPFPKYDNHADHGFTTVAICEALETLPERPARLLLYINHCLLTEHWPFGPAGTGVSLPPSQDSKMQIRGVWSRPVLPEEQRDKFLALEAMHDLREPPRPGIPTWRQILAELRNATGTKVHGMERRPNNYFRRAVRANELFFVTNYEQLWTDAQRFANQFRN